MIEKSIALIKSQQNRDGGFSNLSSFDKEDFSHAIAYQTSFFAANILSCLNSVSSVLPKESAARAELKAIQKSAVRFLLAQKSEGWSFNYWSRGAKERSTMPYPDDLDDTFVALAALRNCDPNIIDGGVLAQVAKLLTAVEVVPGGPYRTWLVGSSLPPEWRDVDVVVNSNVGYFLSLFEVTLSNLTRFVDERIQNHNMGSPYYPGMVQTIYFVSRFYKGEQKAALAEMLFRERCEKQHGEKRPCENPLESAMAISALVNLGIAHKISESDIATLADRVKHEGWSPYPFCIDPSRDGKTCYAGSPALTAAFCAEALAKYFSAISASGFVAKGLIGIDASKMESTDSGLCRGCNASAASDAAAIFERIKTMARRRTPSLPCHLKDAALQEIDAIVTEEIVLMPYLVHAALGARAKHIPGSVLDELALANLCGWIAYTIYDDFLDGEGKPLLLSAANFFLREFTTICIELENQVPRVVTLQREIVNGIDNANIWEQRYCRAKVESSVLILPRELPYHSLENLADRSLGHALPALAVLLAAGYAPDSLEAEATLSFFRHYLIARQLHDDARDWSEDLLRGHVTSVGARLIRMWRAERGEARRGSEEKKDANREFDVAGQLPDLKRFFWYAVIPGIVADIKSFLNRARHDLATVSLFENATPLVRLVERLESAARRVICKRDQVVDFLRGYRMTKS